MKSIAVLGCGSIGRRHLRILRSQWAGCLFAYDPDPEARCRAERETGACALSSLDEIWSQNPGAVFICTPTGTHLELAMEAAKRGAHLFIEKPVSHSLAGLNELNRIVERNGLTAMVGCNFRFRGGVAHLHRRLQSGVIGAPISARFVTGSYLPRWRSEQDYKQSYSSSETEGGVLLDCIHEIDLALWMLGDAELKGSLVLPAQSIGLKTDGVAELLLKHSSSAISSLHLDFVRREYRREIEIVGSEGSLRWNFTDGLVQRFGPDGVVAETWSSPEDARLDSMYEAQTSHFLRHAATGEPTGNDITQAGKALRIALRAREEFHAC